MVFRPAPPADWATLTYVPKDVNGRSTGLAQAATTRPRATGGVCLAQYASDRFQDDFNAPDLTGKKTTKAMNKRGQNVLPAFYDLSMRTGHGLEFEVVANLAKGLRVSANFALPKVYVEDVNSDSRKYIDSHGDIFRQIAQDANVSINPTTNVASVAPSVPAAIRSPDAQAAADAYNTIYQVWNSLISGNARRGRHR